MVCDRITAVIVDDEPDVRLLMRLVLESSGSNCIVIGEAASGSEAIELLDTLRPDCFVLDVMMPGMDGIETADRIRAVAPDQKVVFCSAHFDHGERALPECDAFLSKQDVDQLPAVLKSVVSCC
jgi:CheY-like chemotaxis protein